MDKFRGNMFGEKIAQPGVTREDIDDVMVRQEILMAEITNADLFMEKDEVYGYGGELFLSGEDMEGDIREAQMSFDGFDTLEAAKEWLYSIELTDYMINEVA